MRVPPALLICLLSMSAWAEDSMPARWIVSMRPASFLARGIELQVERYFRAHQFSGALSLGYRSPISGDWTAVRFSLGAEGRWWFWRGGPAVALSDTALGGGFSFARVDGSLSSVWRASVMSRSATRWSICAGAGYRFLPVWRLEMTPNVGAAVAMDDLVGGNTPAIFAPRLQLGLTVGVVL